MKKWLVMMFAVVLGAGLVMEAAEARRLGGARSLGAQRQMAPQKPAQQQQQAGKQQNAAAPAAAQGARPGMGRWLAPLAGLAAGLGLAALFGDEMGSLLVAMLIAAAVFFVIRALLRGMGAGQQQRQRVQYAGLDRDPAGTPPAMKFGGGTPRPQTESTPTVPAGFDSETFLREAKRQFVALQAANDHGDVESIRDFVTDDLYAELKEELDERQGATQQTDVVTLEAQLEEVVTEGLVHWASIRFSGMLREEGNGAATHFEELWHLQKSAVGNSGWLLAGIQQVG